MEPQQASPSGLPRPGLPGLTVLAAQNPAIDPVCGMTVAPAQAAASSTFEGRDFFFCHPSCKARFDAAPRQFLDNPGRVMMPARPSSERTVGVRISWICPMDPEVLENHPGPCPVCGMALEPDGTPPESEPSAELRDMQARLGVGLVFGVPLFLLAMSHLIPGSHSFVEWQHSYASLTNVLQLLFATPIVFWCGAPFFARGAQTLLTGRFNMFTLVGLGVGVAYGYSALVTFFPGLFPQEIRHHQYFESAAAIVVLVLLGQVLEIRARNATTAAQRRLLRLAPRVAHLVEPDGRERDVPVERVSIGDMVRIRPGEAIPVDGTVTDGQSAVDESPMSGEPIPVEKVSGATVLAGTTNGTGTLRVRVERVGETTRLAQLVRLVGEAQRSRVPVQRLVDRVSAVFVPGVLLLALATLCGWLLLGTDPERLSKGILHAVAVLIIACPCALGLATPMAVVVGLGRAAEQGILFSDATALEVFHKADILIVDKTGTLTLGQPKLYEVQAESGFSRTEILTLAASLERASEHPLARAIVAAAEAEQLSLVPVEGFLAVPGKGVAGRVGGRAGLLGNEAFFNEQGISIGEIQDQAATLRAQGQTVLFVAIEGRAAGCMAVSDPIRPEAAEALKSLRADGLRIVMVTGDHQATAHAVAQRLGITEVKANVLPQEKDAVVQRFQEEGHVVAMAGDGINDAPALARADVGVAMGTGTDVAKESAGLTLIRGDLLGIARARKLSRATVRGIWQNLFLAFCYNTLAIPLAMAGLATPVGASVAMSLSSLSVIVNALRLRWVRL